MTVADEARASALHCEMKKHFLRQSKDGVVVSFVVHPQEIPHQLQVSDIGSRWMVALVQIGDDELPINQPAKEQSRTAIGSPAKPSLAKDKPSEKAKLDWRDVQPAAQAGIRCSEIIFWTFLREKHGYRITSADEAANAVRGFCNIDSRAELGTKHAARMLWKQLDDQYAAWKVAEHA